MVTEVILPKLGQTMEEGTIVEWLKQEGEPVQRGEVLFMVETDKATLEVEATARGFLRKILVPVGETVSVLTVVALITKTPDEDISAYEPRFQVPGSRFQVAEAAEPATLKPETSRVIASPRARRAARERGVDLAQVTGSGPNGRIVERDVVAYLERWPKATPEAPFAPPGEVPSVESVPLTRLRRIIAERMATSARETARVTLVTEADATAFVEAREQLKADVAEEWGFAPGYNDLLGIIVARALREFPHMNARLSADGQAIERLSAVNLGMAVDTERGLLVPVIQDADRKGLRAFGVEFRTLAERARAGKSLPDDLAGGTFTITNLGMHEVDAFTPIINLPEAAILGVGRIQPQPVVCEGEIVVRQMWMLSLTFDHRVVDGAPAARFLQRIKQLVENPYLLLG
ncbi:MAG: dihydrolipoamide acetyltransferase family protein [Anaerolineae bacterium]